MDAQEEKIEAIIASAQFFHGMVSSSSGMKVVVRNKRDMRPLLLKLGVAVAFSFAGFFVSHLRSRLRSQSSVPGDGLNPSGGKINNGGGLKDELRILKNDDTLAKIINGTTTTTTTTTTTVVELSPSRKSPGDEDGFLLPEFNEIMKEFEASERDTENITPTSFSMLKKFETEKHIAMEQEIEFLRNLVVSLSERERCLELQLLEYYGMEEQKTAMRELESKMKMNTMETKLYTMKIESLETENHRLQALVSDYSRAMSELESSRAKVKLLKRKLKSDGEHANEKISAMHQMIGKFQAKEANNQSNLEMERQAKRLNDLEDEVENVRMINSRLLGENSELMKKLEAAQILPSSLEVPKADLVEDVNHMREVNEKLMNDIDQLKTDRCADVEQLVYLRWVNACLRYELRNYQPPPGKAAATDLSKNLSPKSEATAKQLILEYAKSTGDEKGLVDFESEYSYPSSHVSTADSEENSFDISSTTATNSPRTKKSKFLIKLKKLVLGKNTHITPPISHSNSERRMSISSSTDDVIGRDSYDSFSSCATEEHGAATELILMRSDELGQGKAVSRTSMDMQEFGKQRLEVKEVKGEQCRSHESREAEQERMINLCRNSLLETEDKNFPEKAELKRFAEVLRGSNKMSKIIRKRSSSFSHI